MNKKETARQQRQEAPRSVKRRYFVPSALASVEASSPTDAVEKLKKKEEAGDVNK